MWKLRNAHYDWVQTISGRNFLLSINGFLNKKISLLKSHFSFLFKNPFVFLLKSNILFTIKSFINWILILHALKTNFNHEITIPLLHEMFTLLKFKANSRHTLLLHIKSDDPNFLYHKIFILKVKHKKKKNNQFELQTNYGNAVVQKVDFFLGHRCRHSSKGYVYVCVFFFSR